jgi:hypothetical protein
VPLPLVANGRDFGDILWYVADTATWLGVALDEVAVTNLGKIARRWQAHAYPVPTLDRPMPAVPRLMASGRPGPARLFDGTHPDPAQRLPRKLEVHIAPIRDDPIGRTPRVLPVWNGMPCGNLVADNSYGDDGYRYHDVLHLAHLAILGWSPVMRALLGLKRKATPEVDDVEDGGRAIAIEEGLTAFVFGAASRSANFENATKVDGEILHMCHRMTETLEAGMLDPTEWERAILLGYACWREIRASRSGAILCDLDARAIEYRGLTVDELDDHAKASKKALREEAKRRKAKARRSR